MTKRRNGAKTGETSPAPVAEQTTVVEQTTAPESVTEETPVEETTAVDTAPEETTESVADEVAAQSESEVEEPVVNAEALAAQAEAAEASLEASVQAAVETAPVVPHADKSAVVQTLLNVVDDYMAHMDTNVYPSDENGKALQRRIYRTLRTIIELPSVEDFIPAMQYVIETVRAARGPQRAFNENRVFRFYEQGVFNQTEGRAAEILISFIIQMADGFRGQALNSALKMLVTSNVLTDTVAQRLGSFAQRYSTK